MKKLNLNLVALLALTVVSASAALADNFHQLADADFLAGAETASSWDSAVQGSAIAFHPVADADALGRNTIETAPYRESRASVVGLHPLADVDQLGNVSWNATERTPGQ